MPRLQTESIFCHHKLKWWLWDERMKTMYSMPSCFAEPNLHPFPRTAHFTNIRRRFSIVSNCHYSFPSTECLWKKPRTHSHRPLMFLWVLSFWISWVFTEEGVLVRKKPYSFKREKRLFKNQGHSAIWATYCLIRILKRIHSKEYKCRKDAFWNLVSTAIVCTPLKWKRQNWNLCQQNV